MNRTEAIVATNLLLEPAIKILKVAIIEALVQDMDEFSFKYETDDILDDQKGLDGFSVAFCIAKDKAEYEEAKQE